MGENKLFVKNTFDAYFDRLREMAEAVEELNKLSKNVTEQRIKSDINRVILQLESEIKSYAEKLRTGGTEIIKRVA